MRLAALVLAALVAPASAQAPGAPVWEELAASPYNSYRSEDVFFLGPRGWAVTGVGGGRAYRTLDGGATWAETARLGDYLRAVGFATPDVGWVGVLFSQTTQLYETRNGGLSYTDVTARIRPALQRGQGICGLWVVDAQTVYAAGQYSSPAYILKTVDGGATWTNTPMAPLVDELIDIRFFDAQHGLAVGGTGPASNSRARIIGTDDGGRTWTVRHTVPTLNAVGWKLTFPTRLVGYASVERFTNDPDGGQDAIVLKTLDGGRTWAEIRVPDGGSLQGIGFATPDMGWISGRGRTSVTTDGGLTWARVTPARTGTRETDPVAPGGQLDGDVNRFRFAEDAAGNLTGYAAGHRLYRLAVPRPTAMADAPGRGDGLGAVWPNPSRGPVTVAYRTEAPGEVRLDVFDVRGRRVAGLADGPMAPGDHVATWNPGTLASGLYVVRLQAGPSVWTRSVSLVGR